MNGPYFTPRATCQQGEGSCTPVVLRCAAMLRETEPLRQSELSWNCALSLCRFIGVGAMLALPQSE
jgi:hypothetical protein